MDEWTLNDLLECSVCLERLDTSSKVLPCQHTFCKKCLEEILNTKKELRCPECRVLVEVSIDELPPNVLLMRILEGMRNAAPRRKSGVGVFNAATSPPGGIQPQSPVPNTATQGVPQSTSQNPSVPAASSVASAKGPELMRPHPNAKQAPVPNLPFARAMYDYVSKEPGDLSFKKGDIIQLKKKVDNNWYHGECGGNHGVFPLCYVQVLIPPPSHVPQCKALYDFRMTNDEEGGCLSFSKGEIISVMRRVDENWAEGKLAERVGIFPLAFVEMNSVARALMKLSINSQPGPSRLAPPTPTSDDTSPLIPTDHSRTPTDHGRTAQTQQAPGSTPVVPTPQHPQHPQHPASDSGSSVSSTPNTSSSSTSPSSPASPPPRPLPPALVPASPVTPVTSPQSRSSLSPRVTQEVSQKRHSLNALLSSPSQTASNRHSAELLTSDSSLNDSAQEGQSSDALTRHGSGRRHRRSGSSEVPLGMHPPPPPPQGGHYSVGSTVDMPATYVALYPYKPQKHDELGLRKGLVYTVTERCQDGWYKGTCNRTQRSGVFPGNYVALSKSPAVQAMRSARSSQASQPTVSTPSRNGTSNGNNNLATELRGAISYTKERKPAFLVPTLTSFKGPAGAGWLDPSSASLTNPPELPPRSLSPHSGTVWPSPPSESRALVSSSPPPSLSSALASSSVAGAVSAASSSNSPALSTTSTTPVTTPVKSSSDKSKEKKSGVSLMRRLTIMKKSKSPPPPYSMDNPVFEDGIPSGAAPAVATPAPSNFVHVRSGSCPSQLLQVAADGPVSPPAGHPVTQSHPHRLMPSGGSKRCKMVEPNSLIMANMTHYARPAEAVPSATHHRKSNSLDAGSTDPNRKSKRQPTALSERFRCVVAYPPNSKYELELQVGDVIFVHDKRDDGWYRGTQRRTGRTGLFPSSFVEAL